MKQLYKALRPAKHQAIVPSKSRHLRSKRVWAGVGVVLLLVLGVLPAFAAKGPGQVGYSIKRAEQATTVALMPVPSWRQALQLNFANDRIAEAAYVATQADRSGDKNPAKTAATITGLLDTYENTYEARTAALSQSLDAGKKPSRADAEAARQGAVTTYATLELLRLQAPDGAQLAVLTAIDDTQQNIATLNDALGSMPLSASDLAQLARLIPVGIITPADLNQLAGIHSSRQLHAQLKSQIESGVLPADVTYGLDLDMVKQIAPAKAAAFEAVAEFEEMQRISAVVSSSRPTAAQKQGIQAFLASYQAGQAIPATDIQPYVAPIVYGMALSGRLVADLPALNAIPMSNDDQALFATWKGVVDPPNLGDIYQRFTTDAQNQPALHLRTLTRTQQELVDAQKAQVAYLVMPPGWGANQLGTLDSQMGIEIAETQFQAASPNSGQELARISAVQQQLQTELDRLQTTHAETITKLGAKINSFTGTPDQLAQLKSDLASLDQSQTATITTLQTQLATITLANTQLGDSITTVRQEQLTNLTALELRAASNAQTLTNAAKVQLTTSLNQVEHNSQALITGLQNQVNGLGSSHAQLHDQLAGQISTIRDGYQQLTTNVQAQLDAGVATTSQLQTTLTRTQTDLATQRQQLANLNSSTTALSQLVGQVRDSTGAQIHDLQTQVGVIKLDQQTTATALSNLQGIEQTSQSLITGLQTRVDGLGTSQAQLREQLTGEIQTIQANYSQLAATSQAQLDAGVAATAGLQTSLQTTQTSLTAHANQLTSLSSSTASLTQLVNQVQTNSTTQVSTLQGQIDGLKTDQQTIKTSINTVKAQQAADVQQLTSQVAGISVVQAEAQATITTLAQQQTQAQSDIAGLTNNVSTLQTDFATSQAAQTTLQASIASQQSELDSLTTQTQSATASLTAQQAQFSTQLNNLAANAASLSQTVTAVQTADAATKTQLTTLLANPPWSVIPAGTYVSQNQFDALSAQINTQFAQKSAALDQQFQTYQQQLNATTSQLNTQVQALSTTTTSTASQQAQLQTQLTTLTSQVQTLQTQVQTLLHAATPPGTGL